MGSILDKRTRARELTIQSLYELDVQGDEALLNLDKLLISSEMDDSIRSLAAKWIRGTWKDRECIDELVSGSSERWSLSRMSQVDKSILRMSVYHFKFVNDIPPKVVINEAVELAKKYSTAKSPSFVNGVLDAVLKKLNSGNEINDCSKG